MVDVHVHPMVLPDDMEQLTAYLRANDYQWGYQAVKHGGGPPSPRPTSIGVWSIRLTSLWWPLKTCCKKWG